MLSIESPASLTVGPSGASVSEKVLNATWSVASATGTMLPGLGVRFLTTPHASGICAAS